MGFQLPTLLDILSSQQLRTAILFSLGLRTCQIADLLETSEGTVANSLSDCLDRAGCRSTEGLACRLLYEYENGLYDERLDKELAALQSTAKRMLEKLGPPFDPDTLVENHTPPPPKWIM